MGPVTHRIAKGDGLSRKDPQPLSGQPLEQWQNQPQLNIYQQRRSIVTADAQHKLTAVMIMGGGLIRLQSTHQQSRWQGGPGPYRAA